MKGLLHTHATSVLHKKVDIYILTFKNNKLKKRYGIAVLLNLQEVRKKVILLYAVCVQFEERYTCITCIILIYTHCNVYFFLRTLLVKKRNYISIKIK
jgi:hypothetical protein